MAFSQNALSAAAAEEEPGGCDGRELGKPPWKKPGPVLQDHQQNFMDKERANTLVVFNKYLRHSFGAWHCSICTKPKSYKKTLGFLAVLLPQANSREGNMSLFSTVSIMHEKL